MALKPTIKACSVEDCTKLRVTDTTGAYNDPDNLTGWGSPNIDPSDAGFTVSVTVDAGTPIDMLDNMGFPTSTVVSVVGNPASASSSSSAPIGSFYFKCDYPALGTQISDNLTVVGGESDNALEILVNNALDSFGAGYTAVVSGGQVLITAPVGSGSSHNGLAISTTLVFISFFDSNGVDEVSEVVNGPVTGVFTYNDIAANLTDGWHTIVYTITATVGDSIETYTDTIKIFTYCNIKCCVFNKMLEMNDFDICKDSERIASLMHMWNLYNSMLYSANGCGESQATEILTRLQQLCEVDDTTSGCGCS